MSLKVNVPAAVSQPSATADKKPTNKTTNQTKPQTKDQQYEMNYDYIVLNSEVTGKVTTKGKGWSQTIDYDLDGNGIIEAENSKGQDEMTGFLEAAKQNKWDLSKCVYGVVSFVKNLTFCGIPEYEQYQYKRSDGHVYKEVYQPSENTIYRADWTSSLNKLPMQVIRYDNKGNVVSKVVRTGTVYGGKVDAYEYDANGNKVVMAHSNNSSSRVFESRTLDKEGNVQVHLSYRGFSDVKKTK